MTMVQSWLAAHGLTLFVVWLLTGVVNAGFEYLNLHKNDNRYLRGIDSLFSAIGLDAGVVVALVRSILNPPGGGPAGGKGLFSGEVPVLHDEDDEDDEDDAPTPVIPRPVKMTAAYLMVAAALTIGTTGCGLLHSAVPTIDKVLVLIADGEQVLKVLEDGAELFFAVHPDANEQQRYAVLDKNVHLALDTLVRLGDAGKELDSGEMNAAVADFQTVFSNLENFLASAGISAPTLPGTATVGSHVATRPLLMSVRVVP